MNFVFLSPHFPTYYWLFCERLHRNGARVLGIGDQPYDTLLPELQAALDEYYQVDSLRDYDQLVRALGYFTHRHGKIDRLDSLNEYWLETEARLRDDFNIPGLRFPEVLAIRQKSRMKQIYEEAGIPSARFAMLSTLESARTFALEAGYPVVVKPNVGIGAAYAHIIQNERELAAFFGDKPGVPYIIEEYVPGHVVTFDGIIDYEGHVLFASSHSFPYRNLQDDPAVAHTAFHSINPIDEDVNQLGRRVLSAFHAAARFFHVEFFRLDRGKAGLGKAGDLLALEVNLRAPGGMITDMMNFAGDVDVYGMWADMIVYGKLMRPPVDAKYICGFASRRNALRYLHSHQSILETFQDAIVLHLPVAERMRDAMGDYVYLTRAQTQAEIAAITAYIQALDNRKKLPDS